MTKNTIQLMIDSLTAALDDADKFDAGNDSAGKRLRSIAQEVKTKCQALRQDIQTERNNRKAK